MRYGQCNLNPLGVHEDEERCIVEVKNSWSKYQCQRKRGHGPGGCYCRQHGKIEDNKEIRRSGGKTISDMRDDLEYARIRAVGGLEIAAMGTNDDDLRDAASRFRRAVMELREFKVEHPRRR